MSDFILKPYNIEHLKEVVDRLIHQHREKRKEQQQHDELLEKIEKITPVVENECLYAIISNENELELKRSLRLLSPHICSCLLYTSLSQKVIVYSHAFRNALIPVVTIVITQIGMLFCRPFNKMKPKPFHWNTVSVIMEPLNSIPICVITVSYTHLDVYKRQPLHLRQSILPFLLHK